MSRVCPSGKIIETVHFRFLVQQGCIPPLCDLLTVMDSKIVQVALNGLENILRFGEAESKNTGGSNPYAVIIEEVFGLDKIEFLQVGVNSKDSAFLKQFYFRAMKTWKYIRKPSISLRDTLEQKKRIKM